MNSAGRLKTPAARHCRVGVEVRSEGRADGVLYLDYLTWSGAPAVTLRRPDYLTCFNRFGAGENSTMWRLAWSTALTSTIGGGPKLIGWCRMRGAGC
ncbi:MAG: hypothetical protein R2932_41070 [Caldilineaceae bacterium]